MSKDVTSHKRISQVGNDTLFRLGLSLTVGCIAIVLAKPESILSHSVQIGLNVLSLLILVFLLLSSTLRLRSRSGTIFRCTLIGTVAYTILIVTCGSVQSRDCFQSVTYDRTCVFATNKSLCDPGTCSIFPAGCGHSQPAGSVTHLPKGPADSEPALVQPELRSRLRTRQLIQVDAVAVTQSRATAQPQLCASARTVGLNQSCRVGLAPVMFEAGSAQRLPDSPTNIVEGPLYALATSSNLEPTVFTQTDSNPHLCPRTTCYHIAVSYTHLTLPTKRIV
mgnify:CR=1 FL=1